MSKKPYYHQHEGAYQKLKSRGFVGWGQAKTVDELGDAQTKEYLRAVIADYVQNPGEKSALDIGCGSGTTAFLLSRAGFGKVCGIDISETAIEMARDLALKQNLSIEFCVGDVLRLKDLKQRFDFIYDSHCLHCIVHDDDRRSVLHGVRDSLKSDGLFVLDTMVLVDGVTPTFAGLRFDENYILWHESSNPDHDEVVEKDGKFWSVQRRIYPAAKLLEEVAEAGFQMIGKRIDPQENNHPAMLRLVLKSSKL